MATVKGTYWSQYPPLPTGKPYLTCPIYSETFAPGSTNDTRKLIQINSRGITFGAGTFIQAGDMDSGTALVLTLQVTDGTTTKILIHQSTVGQAGGIARPTKIGTTETAIGWTTTSPNFWVELLIATQATGAQSAVFTYGIEMSGFYLPGAVTE